MLLFSFFVLTVSTVEADVVHIVTKGETIYSLSKRYGISPETIIENNSITNVSEIGVGTRLLIPSADDSVSGDEKDDFYEVKQGDTYYSISRKLGLSLEQLLALNGRDENRLLRVGEVLIVDASRTISKEQMPGNSGRAAKSHEEEKSSVHQGAGNVAQELAKVPWWPVNGRKRILDGKLVGVSIETEPLSYVYAVAGGNVVWTGPYRGFGYVVLVDSKGYIYLYGGNEDLFVNVGQTVEVGSRIGRLGMSASNGVSYGRPEMIFAVFRDGVPVPPSNAPRG